MSTLISFIGVCTLFAVAYLFSQSRRSVRWRTVLGAFALQFIIGGIVLYVPLGRSLLESVSAGVTDILSFAQAGIDFTW